MTISPAIPYDVVVIGATPAGICAAQAAARQSARVCVIESSQYAGGVLTGGLSVTDSGDTSRIGGLAAAFFAAVGVRYAKPGPWYSWRPQDAATIFLANLNNPLITTMYGRTLAGSAVYGGRIENVTLDNGVRIAGMQWVDASYEGDLMMLSGTQYAVGRESSAQYIESMAGEGQFNFGYGYSPYVSGSSGPLLYGVNANPGATVGQADGKYCTGGFRVIISSDASRLPFPRPAGYVADNYLGVLRVISTNGLTTHAQLWSMQSIPGANLWCGESSNFPPNFDCTGLDNWAYADGNWTTRAASLATFTQWVQGYLYFLANDPRVPSNVQTDVNLYGLPAGEFTLNGGWPTQYYIREGRRMIGQKVMTQADVTAATTFTDVICMGQFEVDMHSVNVCVSNDGTQVEAEGSHTGTYFPFQVPLRTILSNQISNLAVPVCNSASHVAYSAQRTESVFMMMGEAAGQAAGMAWLSGIHGYDLAGVNVSSLQSALSGHGAILS